MARQNRYDDSCDQAELQWLEDGVHLFCLEAWQLVRGLLLLSLLAVKTIVCGVIVGGLWIDNAFRKQSN